MNERIEAFLQDVLSLEGEIWNLSREGVRRYLAAYEKQFRDDEPNKPGAQLGDPPSFDPSIYNDCLTILTR